MGTYCGKWNKLWMDFKKLKAMKWSSITRQKCRNSATFLFKKWNKSPTCLKNNKWWNLMCVKLNQNSAEIFSHFQSWGKNDSFVKAAKFWRKMPENFFTRKIHFIFLGGRHSAVDYQQLKMIRFVEFHVWPHLLWWLSIFYQTRKGIFQAKINKITYLVVVHFFFKNKKLHKYHLRCHAGALNTWNYFNAILEKV